MSKRYVVVLGMGGTITGEGTSEYTTTNYQSGTLPVNTLAKNFPFDDYNIFVKYIDIFNDDSTNMTSTGLLNACKIIHGYLDNPDVDGVVVAHGTCTLKETAIALHLTANSRKPIIMTAAVRPASALGTDGSRNLFTAIIVAADPSAHDREVMIILNDDIWPCLSTFKWDINSINAFRAHQGALGRVVNNTPHFFLPASQPTGLGLDIRKLPTGTEIPVVVLFSAYPEFPSNLIKAAIDGEGAKAIVFAGFGSGYWGEGRERIEKMLGQSDVLAVMSHQGAKGIVSQSRAGFGIAGGSLLPRELVIILKICLVFKLDHAAIGNVIAHLGGLVKLSAKAKL